MTRKEIIECLEQLRLEEACFNRRKENRALRAAIRTMKYDRTKRIIVILLIAALLMLSVWLGMGIGTKAEVKDFKQKSGRCYDIVFYDGADRVDITTGTEYINGLSDDTVIITDRSLDEVTEEIEEMQDDAEERR